MDGSEAEPLPPLYAKWTGELLGAPIPRESRAACATCVMRAPPAEAPDPKRAFFDPVIKCCTYQPVLFNFLVGRILADDEPDAVQGKATVERRIAQAVGVTPLGLMQSPTFALAYASAQGAFGRSRSLKCPHYLEESGQCGVWRHRESTCATWFCKHVRGGVGFRFWRQALHPLLRTIEIDLARWCLLEIGVSAGMLSAAARSEAWRALPAPVTGASLDGRVDQPAYERLWGEWRGRERELYLQCAGLASPLSFAEALEICGPEAQAMAALTKTAFAELTSAELPQTLEMGAFRVVQRLAGATRLATYSDYDPIDVPDVVMSLLAEFDGRETAEVVSSIARARGLGLEPELLRKLVDFAILAERRPAAPVLPGGTT